MTLCVDTIVLNLTSIGARAVHGKDISIELQILKNFLGNIIN